MNKKYFLIFGLLLLIININNKQIKVLSTVNAMQKQLTVEKIIEQYYQYTINNCVNEKYHFFNQILDNGIKKINNNSRILMEYQQLKKIGMNNMFL